MKKFLFAVLFLSAPALATVCPKTATTYNCAAGTSNADVQATVNAATEFDTINLAAGAYAWNGPVTINDKSLVIQGAGVDVTNISMVNPAAGAAAGTYNNPFFNISLTSSTHATGMRLTGMTLLGNMDCGSVNCGSTIIISSVGTPNAVYGWKLDNMKLNLQGHTGIRGIFVFGVTWGLIEYFEWAGQSYLALSQYGYVNSDPVNNAGQAYYSHPTNLGTVEAVYVENSILNMDGNWPALANDAWFGGSVVFRHNVVRRTGFQSHGAGHSTGARGGMKQEIYANDMDGVDPNLFSTYRPSQFRSGTFVIFNNQVRNYGTPQWHLDYERAATTACSIAGANFGKCDGTSPADQNVPGEFGWACLDQPGRGSSGTGAADPSGGTNEPVWAWNNGRQATCMTGGACDGSSYIALNPACAYSGRAYISSVPHATGQVDYVNSGTPKPGYTPLVFPHPLHAGGAPPPPPPPPTITIPIAPTGTRIL